MDFEWDSESQKAYDDVLAQTSRWPRHVAGFYTREQWQKCAGVKLLGLAVPVKYGGAGMGALSTARAIEAFGRGYADMGLVFGAAAHLLACAVPISLFGSESLRAAALPRLSSGEWIAANAITEEEAGSDVHALHTRAVRDGDVYVLNGTKSFVSNGPIADVFLVYAMTEPAFGHLGITAFLVDRDAPGVLVGEPFEKTSLASCPAGMVLFEDCRVPVGRRLGAEGQGSAIFKQSMQWERTCLMAGYIGLAERALEHCVKHVTERRQFGRPLGVNQAVSHRLVDARLRLESARLLLWRACWMIDHDRPAVMDASLAKLAISESVVRTALDVIHLLGGEGIRTDTGVEVMLRDALPSTLFSGTSEMQRELVAKEMGL